MLDRDEILWLKTSCNELNNLFQRIYGHAFLSIERTADNPDIQEALGGVVESIERASAVTSSVLDYVVACENYLDPPQPRLPIASAAPAAVHDLPEVASPQRDEETSHAQRTIRIELGQADALARQAKTIAPPKKSEPPPLTPVPPRENTLLAQRNAPSKPGGRPSPSAGAAMPGRRADAQIRPMQSPLILEASAPTRQTAVFDGDLEPPPLLPPASKQTPGPDAAQAGDVGTAERSTEKPGSKENPAPQSARPAGASRLMPTTAEPLPPPDFTGIDICNPNGKKPLIMVVDDEREVANTIMRMLVEADYRVVPVYDGFEAVRIYKKIGSAIDLVLLDFQMPVMDGEDVFEELCILDPSVVVILSSGFSQQAKLSSLLSRGLRGFMPKPYTLEKLVAQVDQVMRLSPRSGR